MRAKRKAEAVNFGSKTNFTGGEKKAFSISDYGIFRPLMQCRNCRSDYMRASLNGLCQRCLQRAEFVIREHSL